MAVHLIQARCEQSENGTGESMTDFKQLKDWFDKQTIRPPRIIITREHLECALNANGGFVGLSDAKVTETAQRLCEHEDELWYQLAKDIK
jgi:hypothetical protein